jgi:hypothetical protein
MKEASCGVVQLPPASAHTYYIMVNPPKGGIPGIRELQRLAGKLATRFERFDDVVLQAQASPPYLAENGKGGKFYIVLKATVGASRSEEIVQKMRKWPEVVGIYRKYSVETMLFQAFADIYDSSGPECIPVTQAKKPDGAGAPVPAMTFNALESLVSSLCLDLPAGYVRMSFRHSADTTARRASWDSVAARVTRCLRLHRQALENALAFLEASSPADDDAKTRPQNTVTPSQLHRALLAMHDKLGLEEVEVAALVERARSTSAAEGGRIYYKDLLETVCSSADLIQVPMLREVTKRQLAVRQMEGERSREVAHQVAEP